MIVFDLLCSMAGHKFEGWFSSSEDYEHQRTSGMLLCPVCGDTAIEKAVMAPSVSAKTNQRSAAIAPVSKSADQDNAVVPMSAGNDNPRLQELMQALAAAQAEALKNSEWVGKSFADKARAMHYGEEDAKPIHGQVAPQEARDLMEEGVEVAPLLFPIIPPEAQN